MNTEIRNDVIDLRLVDLKELQPFQGKLKELSKSNYAKLRKQIETLGFSEPISVWQNKGKIHILNGHQRLRTLQVMAGEGVQVPKIPAAFIRAKDEKEAKRKVLALTSQFGEMTGDGLVEFMTESGIEWPDVKENFRFPEIDFKRFEAEFFTDPIKEDEVPEPPKVAITKPGDLWILGRHRLLCGDSAIAEDVLRFMGNDRAACVFTDPPYGVAIGAKNRFLNEHQKAGRNLSDIESDELSPEQLKEKLLPAFLNLNDHVLATDGTLFVTAPQGGELGMMMMMMMQSAGLRPRHVLIWKKNAPTFSMGRLDYDYQHEPILLTWGKSHKRPMMGKHRTSVWEIDKPRESKEHPTMKPVELYANAYANNSDNGDVVADVFAGSGPSVIAAEQLNRRCYAIEIEPRYVQVTLERWATLTGKDPVRQNDGKKFSELKRATK